MTPVRLLLPRRRLPAAAALAVTLTLTLPAAPAAAAAPAISISSPGDGAVLGSSIPTIAGEARMGGGFVVGDVVVTLTGLDGDPVPPAQRYPADNRQVVPFSWQPELTRNGVYELRVTATGKDNAIDPSNETATATRRFSIEAAPAVPSGLTATVDAGRRIVLLDWDANPEPDILGYQVERAASGQGWTVVGQTTDTSFTDDSTTGGGSFRYRVIAVREGASPNTGVASGPSASVTASVPAPPVEETPTTGDGDGSGSAGGSGSGTGGTGGGTSGGSSTPAKSSPVLARAGKVDLSSYSALLAQTRDRTTTRRAGAPDPGFGQTLPYPEAPSGSGQEEEGQVEAALPGQPVVSAGDDDGNRVRSIAFLAAGVLVTVVLMHVLWLKAEVDRVPALEPLDPD